jgi:peptide/nickel transport system permease protein
MPYFIRQLGLFCLITLFMSVSLYALFRMASQHLSFGFGSSSSGFVQATELSSPLASLSFGEGYLTWLGILPQRVPLEEDARQEEPFRYTLSQKGTPYAQQWLLILKDPLTQKEKLYHSPLFPLKEGAPTLPEASLISTWKHLANWQVERQENGFYKVWKSEYKGILQGHWGYSLSFQTPVEELMTKRLPITFLLGLMAVLIAYPLAFPFGYFLSQSKGKVAVAFKLFGLFLFSAPSVILGIWFLWLFSWQLKWLPLQALPWWGWRTDPLSVIVSLINPALSLGIPLLVTNSLMVSRRLEEVLSQDYLLFAQAKGLSSFQIATRHLLKIALAPLIVRTRNALLYLVSGSLVIETLFGVAGIGQLSLQALLNNDLTLALALAHLMGILQILGGFIAEGVLVLWYPPSES